MDFGNSLFCLAESVQKGRCVCALQPLEMNTVVLRERFIAVVLYCASRTSFCSYCTDKLSRPFINPCPICSRVYYCSEDCRKADRMFFFLFVFEFYFL
jgi:hypothetical protein